MLEKVKNYIRKLNMIEDGESVVVGVSGGADSMCLLNMLNALGIKVFVVHINHMIRGKDALNDMQYVENFCKDKGIECYSFSYEVERIAKEEKISCEEAGRILRYKTFYEVMEKTGAGKIAVAHNAGDNAETILHNLFRGTGMKGLTGITPKRDCIIRPLLCLEREEIIAYLKNENIEYCNDSTNDEDIYTRNKIRHNILGYGKAHINEKIIDHVCLAGEILSEADDFIEIESEKAYKNITVNTEDSLDINVDEFKLLHTVLQKSIIRKAINHMAGRLKDITSDHIISVIELFDRQVGKSVNLPYEIIAVRKYNQVQIKKNFKKNEKNVCVNVDIDGYGTYQLNDGIFEIYPYDMDKWAVKDDKYEEKMYTKYLDCGILGCKLAIRTRKTGDYIIVDSKGSKKKIKDLFIDMKIPKEERDNVLLLAKDNEIIWIIGGRINYQYRITEDTKEIVKIIYSKTEEEL